MGLRLHGRHDQVKSLIVCFIVMVTIVGWGFSGQARSAAGTAATGFPNIPDIVSRVEPSVVTIMAGSESGSGVVYRQDGVIVTNQHVAALASDGSVQVMFADGRRMAGRVQAADKTSDIAVVRVDRTGLPAVTFRRELPRVGEPAVVIGSPLGLANSVTAGIISGLNRVLPAARGSGSPAVDLIQTDAAISPGNSGGALLDGQGRVVGINDAYVPPQTGAVSLGFAIPSATVVNVVEQLLTTGKARHAFVGVQLTTLTPQIAAALGLDVDSGALVLNVSDGSPGQRAGLRTGDVIVSFDGKPVTSAEQFSARLRDVSPGDTVTIGIDRDGGNRQIRVTVTDQPT